jgi:hypothetical protein
VRFFHGQGREHRLHRFRDYTDSGRREEEEEDEQNSQEE